MRRHTSSPCLYCDCCDHRNRPTEGGIVTFVKSIIGVPGWFSLRRRESRATAGGLEGGRERSREAAPDRGLCARSCPDTGTSSLQHGCLHHDWKRRGGEAASFAPRSVFFGCFRVFGCFRWWTRLLHCCFNGSFQVPKPHPTGPPEAPNDLVCQLLFWSFSYVAHILSGLHNNIHLAQEPWNKCIYVHDHVKRSSNITILVAVC